MHVLHRPGKAGLGAAYISGFTWGLDRAYDVLVEMDADGSHQPEELPGLLGALRSADLVIGSRWMPGGRVLNWPKSREILSRGGNAYTRTSQGYCFQVDPTLRTARAGLRVAEVPIAFVEHTRGASKMSRAIVLEALLRVTGWAFSSKHDRAFR